MQPFDALTMRAVLKEAGTLIINRRVEGVYQCGPDELLLLFRGKSGGQELRLSADPQYGRICLVKAASNSAKPAGDMRTNFAALLKKSLYGATLIGIEQLPGERVIDLVFSCIDEVGGASLKTLSAEIMGRYSNLVFWQRHDQKILAASHLVSSQMSRLRQIQSGSTYARPPVQKRTSVFTINKKEFVQSWQASPLYLGDLWGSDKLVISTEIVAWLTANFSGLGKNLVGEIVQAAVNQSAPLNAELLGERLWSCLDKLQNDCHFKPAMKNDLSRYTILDLAGEVSEANNWQILPAVNDLIEIFYSANQVRQNFKQTKERMLKDALAEIEKLKSRWQSISQESENSTGLAQAKLYGDLILANLPRVDRGQTELICQNIFSERADDIVIPLNGNLTAVQNAQNYYRQFAKARNRKRTAELSWQDAQAGIARAQSRLEAIEKACDLDILRTINQEGSNAHRSAKEAGRPSVKKGSKKNGLLSVNSSDGWLIYVGRNRQENDILLSKISQPRDLWMHILGYSGAHVLVRVPSSKADPPLTTIKEAAQLAARFSKVASGAKVRVVYTEARFVKRAPSGKAGAVNYENERTIQVDTSVPLPKIIKQLFMPKV